MYEILNWFEFSIADWIISLFCGLLIGTAKAGVAGTGIMIVPIMAVVFGGKLSTGIVLPMLIIADIYAVIYYHRFTNWKYVVRVMPWAVIGILIGLMVGNSVSDQIFKRILSITVILVISIMIWRDFRKTESVPDYWWFAMILGLAGGFATMIGNAAGPVMAMYLLAMRIPKMGFIGVFLGIQIVKVIPENLFRILVISTTLGSAILLI